MAFFKLMMSKIMASSVFDEHELDNPSIDVIRELVFRVASLILPTAAVPVALYKWYLGSQWLAVIEWMLSAALFVNVYILYSRNARIVSSTSLLLIAMVIVIAAIIAGHHEFIYMCYAFPVALYLLVNPRQSLFLNAIWWAISSSLAITYLPIEMSIAYTCGHGITCIFLHVLFTMLGRHEKQLKELAQKDPLTHALNRRAMRTVMTEAIQQYERYETISSIIVFDIDNFKEINDSFGHSEGDTVLRNLVAVASSRMRCTDRIVRFGGEEFVLILPNTNNHQAYFLAESLREQVSQSNLSTHCQVTISCGVSEIRHRDTIEIWMKRGDMALYRAKHEGRNCVISDQLVSVA